MENSTRIINLTGHAINLRTKEGTLVRYFRPYPIKIVLKEVKEHAGILDGVRIEKVSYTRPDWMPKVKEGVYYIVGKIVKAYFPEREDFLVPCSVVRNEKGHISGVETLAF